MIDRTPTYADVDQAIRHAARTTERVEAIPGGEEVPGWLVEASAAANERAVALLAARPDLRDRILALTSDDADEARAAFRQLERDREDLGLLCTHFLYLGCPPDGSEFERREENDR